MGVNISPFPSAIWVPPSIKNGTSHPNNKANSLMSSCEIFSLKIWFRPHKMVAALLEPPPKPAPVGIFFVNDIFTPDDIL